MYLLGEKLLLQLLIVIQPLRILLEVYENYLPLLNIHQNGL